ncbi:MAG: DUF3298 domain-containing protein [Mycobacterium sp.]|nr:DUF3298 domain-containing protein [Mycobacterium sp.]
MRVPVAAGLLAVALFTSGGAAAAPQGCGDLGGVVQDGTCTIAKTAPGYMLDVRFPVDYPGEPALLDYVTQTREGFLNVAQTPESRGRPYELDITAESFQSEQTRSVVLTLFQNVGGAHPATWYKSFSYDVVRNAPLTFDTLFAPGVIPMPVVFPIVQRELDNTSGLGSAIGVGDGMNPAHYQNFAVTDDEVIFFFGQGELLPFYAGATSVRVPRSALPKLQV